jgi:hypothetical protein
MQKNYSSLFWYRPFVARTDDDIHGMHYNVGPHYVHLDSVQDDVTWDAEQSTWRPHIDLRATAGSFDKTQHKSYDWRNGQCLGWQERASVLMLALRGGTSLSTPISTHNRLLLI